MDNVKKQYGIWTGIAMVVGIVIGSGVFLKAGGVLEYAGGDLKLSLLAWFIGGIIMIVSGFCFAIFATRIKKFNGVVDYVEVTTSKRFGYHLAWLITTLYYPIVASIVSVFAGAYFLELIGLSNASVIYELLGDYKTYIVAFVFITIFCLLNYLAPKISARFQVSATIIKIIPIFIIAVVGLFASLFIEDGGIINAFNHKATDINGNTLAINFGEAIKKTAFAYEGWVCATSINAELKNSERDLPRALVGGTITILIFYLIYYTGLSAILTNTNTIKYGANAPIVAFEMIFGNIGSKLFNLFIIISCLGTVNGLAISCCRGMYTMSCRNQGICPKKFSKLGKNGSTSFLSCLFGYLVIITLLIIWYLANNNIGIFRYLSTMDEVICAIIYGIYITMYIYIMKNFKDLNFFKRFLIPTIAILGSLFFVICGTGIFQLIATGSTESLKSFGVFLILFLIIMLPSFFFYRKENEQMNNSNN